MFFAPTGGYWMPQLADAIAQAIFVLLVGEKGLGPWQVDEYYEEQASLVQAKAVAHSVQHPPHFQLGARVRSLDCAHGPPGEFRVRVATALRYVCT
jgi:hypothetical protein